MIAMVSMATFCTFVGIVYLAILARAYKSGMFKCKERPTAGEKP